MRIPKNFLAFITLGIAFSTLAAAQDTPKLILNPETADETPIDLDPSKSAAIKADTGNIEIFTLDPQACGAAAGSCPDASVIVSAPNPDPAVVEQGGVFNAPLSSLGAVACRRTGLPGTTWNTDFISPPPDGNRTQTVPAALATGTYELKYECRNGDFLSSQVATLQVNIGDTGGGGPGPVPTECEDIPLPTGWSRDTTTIAKSSQTVLKWSDFFDTEFPLTQGENLAVNEDRYAAFSFDPSTAPAAGSWRLGFADLFSTVSAGIGTVAPTISISTCPGDFRPELGNCRLVSGQPFKFTTDPAEASSCLLPDADTLYLNVTYIANFSLDDPTGFIWTCGGEDECGHFVQ